MRRGPKPFVSFCTYMRWGYIYAPRTSLGQLGNGLKRPLRYSTSAMAVENNVYGLC